jgi:hypothetical protein
LTSRGGKKEEEQREWERERERERKEWVLQNVI